MFNSSPEKNERHADYRTERSSLVMKCCFYQRFWELSGDWVLESASTQQKVRFQTESYGQQSLIPSQAARASFAEGEQRERLTPQREGETGHDAAGSGLLKRTISVQFGRFSARKPAFDLIVSMICGRFCGTLETFGLAHKVLSS